MQVPSCLWHLRHHHCECALWGCVCKLLVHHDALKLRQVGSLTPQWGFMLLVEAVCRSAWVGGWTGPLTGMWAVQEARVCCLLSSMASIPSFEPLVLGISELCSQTVLNAKPGGPSWSDQRW